MPNQVDRYEVLKLQREGAPVIEVLPESEYESEHITGAINVPLKNLDASIVSKFAKERPIVVYCHDFL
jgi:rhodanese-related sulfurtransferase